MALRSLNTSAPERRTSMRRTPIPPPLGSNDENVNLQWSPNIPPRRSCKPSPSPLCSEVPTCQPPPASPCGEAPVLLPSPPLPACLQTSVPLVPPPAFFEASSPQSYKPSPLPTCSEAPCRSEASTPCPSSSCLIEASTPLASSGEPSPFRDCNEAPTPLPSSGEPSTEIEYILSEHLSNLADIDGHVSTLLGRLDSKDWLKVCEALNNMRQLSIYHKSSLLQLLDKAVPLLVKATKNPRSALCKTAIMASADLFRAFPEEIMASLEQLLLQLLLKATQDKRFVCEEADRSLVVMTACLPSASLLVQLQPYVMHRNPRVRAKATSCVYRSVSKLGPEGIKFFGFQPLLQIAASQLNDQLPEARESARKVVAEVYAAFSGSLASASALSVSYEQDWPHFCNAHLSPHFAQAILRLTSGF